MSSPFTFWEETRKMTEEDVTLALLLLKVHDFCARVDKSIKYFQFVSIKTPFAFEPGSSPFPLPIKGPIFVEKI